MPSRKDTQPEARRLAREAKARLDAERAEHDRKVDEATTDFHQAQIEYQELADQLESIRDRRDEQVLRLVKLETKTARVATLTGLEPKHINAIKRAHKTPQSNKRTTADTTSNKVDAPRTDNPIQ